jgi:hypothetical protein
MGEEVVKLAEALNPQQAYVWRQALLDEGIDCRVVGDGLDVTFGDMPGTRPEIWVHQADYERAHAILEEHERARAESKDDDSDESGEPVEGDEDKEGDEA